MIKRVFMTITFATALLWPKGGVDIGALIKPFFSQDVRIEKKEFRLSAEEVIALQKEAKARIDSDIVRLYTLHDGKKTEGYAILLVKKIRSKSAAVLYIMDTRQTIKSIEIVAFAEPQEYKPNRTWQKAFEGKTKADNLFAGKGIPTISGATLSARAISDAARIAIAIVERYAR